MKPHLKTKHIDVWKEYIELKNISTTKDIPKTIEELNEPKTKKAEKINSEESFWEYLEKAATNVSTKDSKIIALPEVTNKRRQSRGPIWQYYQED